MFKQIFAKELKGRLSNRDNLVLLDVREPYEHADSSIPGSILIPLHELPLRYNELASCHNQEIIVYCKAGVRSRMACKFLAGHGFTRLYNLADGILGW